LLRRGDTVVVDADNHRSRDRRRATQAMADMGIRMLVAVVRVEPEVTIARFRDDPRGMTEAMVLAIAQRLARVTSDELRGDGFDQVLEVTL
jgi:predicted kinase